MGIWHCYISIKTNDTALDHLAMKINSNPSYKKAFHFGICKDKEFAEDDFLGGFSFVFDNFLITNYLIYDLLFGLKTDDLWIKTNGIKRKFDFSSKADFIKFMFEAWEKQIDYIYNQFGVMVVSNNEYIKTRNKLHGKFYVKFLTKSPYDQSFEP